MEANTKRWLWRGVKLAAALTVLLFVGWKFAEALAELDFSRLKPRPLWLIASGGLYLLALFASAWFWRHLHRQFGYPMSLFAAVRAHYIGQLGKYVPGKAMALAIRSELVHAQGVPYGVSVIVSFYEVFTGMAAGAFVAALIYLVGPPDLGDRSRTENLTWHPVWTGVILIGICGLPLLPGVFNFLIARLTARIQAIELYRLPPVRFPTLAIGLAATSAGWWLQGLSVWSLLHAVLPAPPEFSLYWLSQCTAAIAFANVAGFVIPIVPGGLGVREVLLTILLSSAGEEPYIAAAAILLRLDWIAAEALFTLCTYWIDPSEPRPLATGTNDVSAPVADTPG
jgi:glycosyltransferase 2 family protein